MGFKMALYDKNMIRVLIATPLAKNAVSGVSSYVSNLERHLIRLGFPVITIYRSLTRCKQRTKIRKFFDLIALKKEENIYIAEALLDRIGVELGNVDLVHAQDPFIAYLIRKLFPKTIIVQTIHGTNLEHLLEYYSVQKGLKPIIRRISGYQYLQLNIVKHYENQGMIGANELIAVDGNQFVLAGAKGVPQSKITIIHNAVDVADLLSKSKLHPVHGSNVPYFLCARRLAAKNGVTLAVRAFLEWVSQRDVHLVIAGDGVQRNEINNLCCSNENGHKVKLLGSIDPINIPALMKNSIATLVPSVPVGGVIEATSFAVLESLALGIPVIASNLGGIAEIDGGSGVVNLVSPGSVRDIANSMNQIFHIRMAGKDGNEERRRKHVLEHFDITGWIHNIIQVYYKALNPK